MLMKQNVNNDITKDLPIEFELVDNHPVENNGKTHDAIDGFRKFHIIFKTKCNVKLGIYLYTNENSPMLPYYVT